MTKFTSPSIQLQRELEEDIARATASKETGEASKEALENNSIDSRHIQRPDQRTTFQSSTGSALRPSDNDIDDTASSEFTSSSDTSLPADAQADVDPSFAQSIWKTKDGLDLPKNFDRGQISKGRRRRGNKHCTPSRADLAYPLGRVPHPDQDEEEEVSGEAGEEITSIHTASDLGVLEDDERPPREHSSPIDDAEVHVLGVVLLEAAQAAVNASSSFPSGGTEEKEVEDDSIITPEEQAQFDALWEANKQRMRKLCGSNADAAATGFQAGRSTNSLRVTQPSTHLTFAKEPKKGNTSGIQPGESTNPLHFRQPDEYSTRMKYQEMDETSSSKPGNSTNPAHVSQPDEHFNRSKEQEKGDWRVNTPITIHLLTRNPNR